MLNGFIERELFPLADKLVEHIAKKEEKQIILVCAKLQKVFDRGRQDKNIARDYLEQKSPLENDMQQLSAVEIARGMKPQRLGLENYLKDRICSHIKIELFGDCVYGRYSQKIQELILALHYWTAILHGFKITYLY